MEGIPILNIIGGIVMYLAKFLFVIASFIALYRKRNTASILLTVGSISILLGDVLALFLITSASRKGVEEVVTYNGINSIIEAVTFIIFAFGVLFYIVSIRKHVSEEK